MASAVEDRDAKISLAKEKLKKFQKKKTTQSSNASISHTVETSSLAGDSVNGSAGDLSLRSSPGLDMRSAVNSSDRRMSEEMGEGPPERRNGHGEGNWPANNGHHFVENPVALRNDVMSSASGDFMTSSSTALNGHNGQDVEEIQRLKRTIDDLVHQNRMLNKEVEMERNSVESKIIGEHQNLREQLTSHIQTIGILVAEKTELQAALTQADFIAKKKASEADNYAAKLSELHEKMTHHERSLNRSSLDGEAQEARFAEQSKEIDKLRETNRSLDQGMDQIRDELYECKRKLGMKDVEVKSLQDRAADLQSRLDSASSLSESTQRKSSFSDLQSEQASGEKKKLEARVHEYQTQISRLQLDMEQMVSRYQALLTQVTSAKDAKQIDPALVSQVEDLQKANQQLQNEIVDLKQEKNHLMGASSEKDDALSRSQSERAQREKVLSQQSEEIESLRSQSIKDQQELSQARYAYDQLTASFTDQKSLLAVMESDKVALSRAMSQNMELKDRLAVLMAELDQSRQDRVLRDQRIQALEAEQRKIQHESVAHEGHQHHSSSIPSTDRSFSMEVQTDPSGEIESAPRFSPTVSPAYMKAFEAKVRNLEDEVIMYKNRQLQADSEVIYLKNALRIREEEAKLLDLTERVGAYRSLEHRFIGAMKQNAELLDRVEQLEHVIMQLQGETETIGDYIALYQSQRSLQRQRELEKVAQIDFLNQEREDLKSKLKQLQVIVRNHLQSSSALTEHTRAPHIDLQQSGDVPDTSTPPMDSVEVATTADGETLSETVVSTDSAVLAEETRVILKLLDDIDTHIKLDPLPTSLSSFSSSSSTGNFRYTTADAMLECSCCTGDLKIV